MDAQRGRVEVVVHGPCEAVDLQRDVEDETGKTDWSNNSLHPDPAARRELPADEYEIGEEDQRPEVEREPREEVVRAQKVLHLLVRQIDVENARANAHPGQRERGGQDQDETEPGRNE